MSRVVTTQAELDAALAEKVRYIEIRSERGVWLRVEGNRGNSSVVARENSSVEARENSSVEARENSSVVARENSSVEAWGNSSVEAWGNSSVVARGNSSVVARGNSSVVARGNSSVEARENSSVEAWENSSVVAWENSSVVAWGASCVRAKGGKSITAGRSVAVHLFKAGLNIKGGVIIDVTTVETDPVTWCDYHGVEVSKAGVATLFKAVNDAWTTDRGFDYSPGSKPSAPDWRATPDCGGGLHFGPTPWHAREYHRSATRYVAVGVKLADLVVIPDNTAKAKAKAVTRACVEVDLKGKEVKP